MNTAYNGYHAGFYIGPQGLLVLDDFGNLIKMSPAMIDQWGTTLRRYGGVAA